MKKSVSYEKDQANQENYEDLQHVIVEGKLQDTMAGILRLERLEKGGLTEVP